MLAALPARGAEVTRVVSAMDGENRFDFNLTATWIHDVKSALVKRELIQKALDETGGNVTQAARKLKISRKSLQTKMKELGLRTA